MGVLQVGADFTGAGTGLSTGLSSVIIAGTGGLDITGAVDSASTSTNLVGVSLNGAASSTGNITVTGTSTANTALGVRVVELQSGTLTGLGAATVTLSGSGVPASLSAQSYDVGVVGTAVSTAGGQIKLIGNRLKIDSSINSGSGRTVITPFTTNREITLGGTDEVNYLNLSNSELNLITASVLAIGGTAYNGGITVANAVTINNTPSLSLVNSSTSGPGISQTAALTVANLNADARSVNLSNAANQISQVSGPGGDQQFQHPQRLRPVRGHGRRHGRYHQFRQRCRHAGQRRRPDANPGHRRCRTAGLEHRRRRRWPMLVTRSALSAISVTAHRATSSFATPLSTPRSIVPSQTMAAAASTSATPAISRWAPRAASAAPMPLAVVLRPQPPSACWPRAASAPSPARRSPMRPVARSTWKAGNGSIGASPADAVNISTAGAVTAVANGGASQVNLALAGGATVENISAPGAVSVTAAAGNLAVKTVAGSAVTLSAAAGCHRRRQRRGQQHHGHNAQRDRSQRHHAGHQCHRPANAGNHRRHG